MENMLFVFYAFWIDFSRLLNLFFYQTKSNFHPFCQVFVDSAI